MRKNIIKNLNITNINKVPFSIRLKIIISVVFALLVSPTIAVFINNLVQKTNLITGNIAVYISTVINLSVVTIIILVFLNIIVLKPIKELINHMKLAGEGDFTALVSFDSRDEMKVLGEAFNEMLEKQAGIIQQVRKQAQELALYSQEMAKSSNQLNSATEQISGSIYQVSQDSDKQNHSVIEATRSLKQLASLIQVAQSKALAVNSNAEVTHQSAQKGREKVKEAVEAIALISGKSINTNQVIHELNNLSAKVGEIVVTINNIAGQTNLLALNAAIEAARAGEHGRGFAVVAEEVRKLAEESNREANEIANLINQMMKQTKRAVSSMDQGQQAVEYGVKVVQETDIAFSQIIDAVEQTINYIREIVDITKEQVVNSEEVVSVIDSVASITENTAASSEEVSAVTEEQMATVENLTSGIEHSSTLASSLEELMSKFKVFQKNFA